MIPSSWQIVPEGDHWAARYHILEQGGLNPMDPVYYRGEKIEFLGANPYHEEIQNTLWRGKEYEEDEIIQMLNDIDQYLT